MTIEERVNELIEAITNELKGTRTLDAKDVFLNGNCGNMYTIFAKYFGPKEAVVPYRISYKGEPYHIVSKIGEDFYDITGKTSLEQYIEYVKTSKGNRGLSFDERDFSIEEIPIQEREEAISQQSNAYYGGYDEDWEDEYTIGSEALSCAMKLKKQKENFIK